MEGQAAMNVADPRARPLHRAALRGLEAFVRTLLVSGRDDANAVDTSGCAPMHWAAQGGSAGCIAQLAAAGADPNAPSTDGQSLTPLHVAAEHGQAASVCALVAAGAALEARCASGRTPLWAAAYFGQLAAVRALLDVGASLEARDVQGRCVLHAASSRGHADVVEALVAAGADAESQNNCACSAECCGPHAAGEGSSMAADAVAGSEDDCTTSVVEVRVGCCGGGGEGLLWQGPGGVRVAVVGLEERGAVVGTGGRNRYVPFGVHLFGLAGVPMPVQPAFAGGSSTQGACCLGMPAWSGGRVGYMRSLAPESLQCSQL